MSNKGDEAWKIVIGIGLVQYENYIQALNMKIENNDDKVTSKSIRKVIKNMESKRDALKRMRDDEDDTGS